MRFDDRIFNEIDTIDTSDFLNPDNPDYDDNWEFLDQLRIREAGYDPDDTSDLTDEQRQEIDETEIYAIHRFSVDSLLWAGLFEWYQGSQGIIDHVRSAILDRRDWSITGGSIWFVSGIGYDWIDSDLLGGNGSGETRKRFIDMLNTNPQH